MSAFDAIPDEERERIDEGDQPRWIVPMKATLTDERFSDDGWSYERKLDGVRVLAFFDGSTARLLSRNRNDLSSTYPELVEAIEARVAEPCILDGEVVAFDGDVTSFSTLQGRMQRQDPSRYLREQIPVVLYLFDVPWAAGADLARLPLRTRKRVLDELVDVSHDPLRLTEHRVGGGEQYLEDACAKGWEGLIAKRANGPYRHTRSRDWLKFKCSRRQELVIGGYTDPKGERSDFGALVLGYHDDDELVAAGKVGTGFDADMLDQLGSKLRSRERETSPFDRGDVTGTDHVHWVTPDLVCEVGFTEWTDAGRLRHPRFLGMRTDKEAAEVVREDPVSAS
jgi:DNA ligase D-like protein (predicted ligase)